MIELVDFVVKYCFAYDKNISVVIQNLINSFSALDLHDGVIRVLFSCTFFLEIKCQTFLDNCCFRHRCTYNTHRNTSCSLHSWTCKRKCFAVSHLQHCLLAEISSNPVIVSRAKFNYEGEEISVNEYFMRRYKRQLQLVFTWSSIILCLLVATFLAMANIYATCRFPQLPLCVERKPRGAIYHPMEVLEIERGQRVTTEKQTSQMVRIYFH